jgi:para-nitrobenzyl esterase
MKSNRRKFIQNLGARAAGLTLGTASASFSSCSSFVNKPEDGQVLYIGDNIAIADTQYGKVK